jgi:hypothetical protein
LAGKRVPKRSLGTRIYVEQAPSPALFKNRRGGGSTQELFRQKKGGMR